MRDQHIALGWTPIRMHDTSNLNMEFHQVNVFGLDVHLLFVLALTLLFPWSMCSLSARVHDLWWCVLRHKMEALSTGFSKGLLEFWARLAARLWNVFLHSFKRTFPSSFISRLGVRKK